MDDFDPAFEPGFGSTKLFGMVYVSAAKPQRGNDRGSSQRYVPACWELIETKSNGMKCGVSTPTFWILIGSDVPR